ncbi:hypothetical protein GIB67_014008 [Kingdonia uniflora]|uniref:Uncharacterized protein n=1 Tax=Kingdonia uniflora TaxID=39325 RepID=A0A7J7L5P0_9MAGN|nr:hypothetical protein GIB67_014008 [Kingdonia uniflora]
MIIRNLVRTMRRVSLPGLKRVMRGKLRAFISNTMRNMLEPWTKESRQIERNSGKPIRQLGCCLKCFVLLTRLKMLRSLLLLKMSEKRRKSIPLITFFHWMQLELHNLSCNLRRLRYQLLPCEILMA